MKTIEKIGDDFVNQPSIKPVKLVKKKVSKNSLISSMEESQNETLTENGAKTFKSTLNATLDFFALGAACRNRDANSVNQLFSKALAEDKLLAAKCLFNIRNIRGGAGERKVFRNLIKFLSEFHKDILVKNLQNVPVFGRWDDLLCLVESPVKEQVLSLFKSQIDADISEFYKGNSISLLAKWLPSANTSSKETCRLAKIIRESFGWNEKQYRKTLSALRAHIEIVESKMSNQEWSEIEYSKVPSKASINYRNAFKKNDEIRYTKFLESVEKGESKINAATLFPYEIYDKAKKENSSTLNLLWENLPNYLEGNDRNILVVADVSGSMSGRPMSVSVSLALYTAERNKGDFNGYFMTFSDTPKLQKVTGKSLSERLLNIESAEWGMSTNLQAVFQKVLSHAVSNKISEDEMPEQIVIISDMEFNTCCKGINLDGIKSQYQETGYKLPNLVFWNVNSRQNNVPAKADDKGVLLVSGCSPSVFKTLLSGTQHTPVDQMLETLNQPMYDCVLV